jgi:hypothetical protein
MLLKATIQKFYALEKRCSFRLIPSCIGLSYSRALISSFGILHEGAAEITGVVRFRYQLPRLLHLPN